MRRLISFVTGMCLALSLFTPQAFAASDPWQVHKANLISDASIIINYAGSEENFLNQLFDDVAATTNEPASKAQLELMSDLVVHNNVSAVLGDLDETSPLFYFIVRANLSVLTDVVDLIEDHEATEKTTYKGYDIYSSYNRNDFAATYKDGAILVTDSPENLKKVIDGINPNKSMTSLYDHIPAAGQILSVMINSEAISKEIEQSTNGMFAFGGQELVAINSTKSDHYTVTSYSKGNSTKLGEIDFDYKDYMSMPTVYKKLPGANTIFYAETHNLYDLFNKIIEGLGVQTELTADADYQAFISEYGDYLDLLNGDIALQMQAPASGVIPYLNIATSITTDQTSTADELTDLINEAADSELVALNTELNCDYDENGDYICATTKLAEGEENYTIKSNDGYTEINIDSQDEDLGTLTMSYGRLKNHYVFSTNPQFKDEFGGSKTLTSNTTFTEAMSDKLNRESISVAYMYSPELVKYINDVINTAGEIVPTPYEKVLTAFSNLDPWTSISIANSSFESTETSELHIPIKKLTEIGMDAFTALLVEDQVRVTERHRQQFSDINFDDENLWYRDHVINQADQGVIKGSNNKFRANDNVTRSEFTAMLVRHYNIPLVWEDQGFTDNNLNAWYFPYINAAADNGIIEQGALARPNDPITRAEAVQMLARTSGALQVVPSEDFNDVAEADWFYEAVGKAYTAGLVTGRTEQSFAPGANLTRAEAAALIDRLAKSEINFFLEFNNYEQNIEYNVIDELVSNPFSETVASLR